MTGSGHILIADDEETFLYSTADLLRREGFQCDCALNGVTALEMLGKSEYELLIADIRMEGNIELELIRNLPKSVEYMPVILVTGYPSMRSAIQSIQLRVTAYLLKPLEFKELLREVEASIRALRFMKRVNNVRKRLEEWREDLKRIEDAHDIKFQQGSPMHMDTFITLTYQNIFRALTDLEHLTRSAASGGISEEMCHLFDCPRLNVLTEGLSETIEVIEKTKSSFRSRDLGELRKKLEGLAKRV